MSSFFLVLTGPPGAAHPRASGFFEIKLDTFRRPCYDLFMSELNRIADEYLRSLGVEPPAVEDAAPKAFEVLPLAADPLPRRVTLSRALGAPYGKGIAKIPDSPTTRHALAFHPRNEAVPASAEFADRHIRDHKLEQRSARGEERTAMKIPQVAIFEGTRNCQIGNLNRFLRRTDITVKNIFTSAAATARTCYHYTTIWYEIEESNVPKPQEQE